MSTTGTVKTPLGFLDTWGGRFANTPDYTGPTSYVNGTGDLLSPEAFGFNNNILFTTGSITFDGLYEAVPQSGGLGYCKWYVRWYVISTGLEVGNGVDLSGSTCKLLAIGV